MKRTQIGVTSLRGPDGKFLPSEPVYAEVHENEMRKAVICEHRMIDSGASVIAKAMKKYIETFKES
jgi:hypothetical protein